MFEYSPLIPHMSRWTEPQFAKDDPPRTWKYHNGIIIPISGSSQRYEGRVPPGHKSAGKATLVSFKAWSQNQQKWED